MDHLFESFRVESLSLLGKSEPHKSRVLFFLQRFNQPKRFLQAANLSIVGCHVTIERSIAKRGDLVLDFMSSCKSPAFVRGQAPQNSDLAD